METTEEQLIAGIKKGAQKSKIEAYKSLLIKYSKSANAISNMQNKLATEPAMAIFNAIKRLDQLHGPRLDWKAICIDRVQKCKSKDGRISAISDEFDYTEDDQKTLINVIASDSEWEVRWRALSVLCKINKDSTDPIYFDLTMQCIANDPEQGRRYRSGMHWFVLEYLKPSDRMFKFLEAELKSETILDPKQLGALLRRSEYVNEFKGLIKGLCEDYFGAGPESWSSIEPMFYAPEFGKVDRSHRLYMLLDGFMDREYLDPIDLDDEFLMYLSALMNGETIAAVGELMKANVGGGYINRNYAKILGRHVANRELASELIIELVNNELLSENERAFTLGAYISSGSKQGVTNEQHTKNLAPLLVNEEAQYFKHNKKVFLPIDDDLEKERELIKEKNIAEIKNKKIIKELLSFICPYVDVPKNIVSTFSGKGYSGVEIIFNIVKETDPVNGPIFVLSVDGLDRESVPNVIDLSRESLGLPLSNEVYPNDESYSKLAHEQFKHYASYLDNYGLSLVDIDTGSSDPTYVVISTQRKESFQIFVAENLPDISLCIV